MQYEVIIKKVGGRMKKLRFVVLIFCVLLLATSGAFAKDNMGIKYTLLGGIDVVGEAEAEFDNDVLDDLLGGDEDVDPGLTIGIEGALPFGEGFEVGLGFRYLIPRDIDQDEGAVGVSAIIPYLLLQYNIPVEDDIAPYLVIHLGYGVPLFDTSEAEEALEDNYSLSNPSYDATPGFHYGIGAGLYFTEKVGLQFLYSVSNFDGQLTSDGLPSEDLEIKYTRLTIAVTYSYN